VPKYRKKPVVIEAIEFVDGNEPAISEFVTVHGAMFVSRDEFVIPTLEGDMTATRGDYIIKGVQGEFYPCKPDIFEATYELVSE
jgi:hypothetical protein